MEKGAEYLSAVGEYITDSNAVGDIDRDRVPNTPF